MKGIETRSFRALGACLPWLAAACLMLPVTAAPADPNLHALFEARCGACHGHAGPFAREKLVLVEGVLRGRNSARAIAAFLPDHYGRLSPAEAAALHDLFIAQIRSGGLFEEKCRICHVRANELAHNRLVVLDSVLHGRYSGREIGAYLRTHGRLTAEEAERLTQTLTEMLRGQQ